MCWKLLRLKVPPVWLSFHAHETMVNMQQMEKHEKHIKHSQNSIGPCGSWLQGAILIFLQLLVYASKWGACPQCLPNALAACSYTPKHPNRTGLDCWLSHLDFSCNGPWFHYRFSMFLLPCLLMCTFIFSFHQPWKNQNAYPEPVLNPWTENGGGRLCNPVLLVGPWYIMIPPCYLWRQFCSKIRFDLVST